MKAKPMQMQILPAHGCLENGMHLGDGRITGHQKSPPDHGRNIAQRDLELIHLDGSLFRVGAHVLRPRSLGVCQGFSAASSAWSEVFTKTKVSLALPTTSTRAQMTSRYHSNEVCRSQNQPAPQTEAESIAE